MKSTKQNKRFHSKSTDTTQVVKILLSLGTGAVIGFACFLLLLGLFSAILLASPTPLKFVTPAALASIYLSAFVCGFFCTKKSDKCYPLVCSLLAPICFYMLLYIFSLPFGVTIAQADTSKYALLLRLLVLPCSLLGSLCGSRTAPKKRKKRF